MRFLARTTTLLNKIFDDLLPGNDVDKMPCSWSHSPQWDELLRTNCVLDEFPHTGAYTHVMNEIMCVFQKYMDDRRVIYEQEMQNMRSQITIITKRDRSKALEVHKEFINRGNMMHREIDRITALAGAEIDGATRTSCDLMYHYESLLRREYISHSEGYRVLMQYVMRKVFIWYRDCLMTASPSFPRI